MDAAIAALTRVWMRFRRWYAQAARGVQIALVVGALIVICGGCSVGLEFLNQSGAHGSPSAGVAGHQATVTGTKPVGTKATKATKTP